MREPDHLVPASAYLLADHLDATLAAGEDLLTAGQRAQDVLDRAAEPRALDVDAQIILRQRIEMIRALELALVTRILKAREWSQALVRTDPRFKLIGGLFIAGTTPLVDALADLADSETRDFATGDGLVAYFRTRGTITTPIAGLGDVDGSLVTEQFLIAGMIELGALLDLAAAYLDALEAHFVVFGPAVSTAAATPEAEVLTPADILSDLDGLYPDDDYDDFDDVETDPGRLIAPPVN